MSRVESGRCTVGFVEPFIGGLTKISIPSFVGTIAVALATCLLCVLLITPEYVGAINWSDDKNNNDEFGALTSRATAIAHPRDHGCVYVGVISASPLRDAISDSTILTDALSEAWLQEVRFANLTAGNLTLWETLTLADNIADEYRGVVLISISPNKFCRGSKRLGNLLEDSRLGIKSNVLQDEARRRGHAVDPLTGIYVVDNFGFLSARRHSLLQGLLTNRPESQRINNGREVRFVLHSMHSRVGRLKRLLANYFDEVDSNIDLLRLVVQRLHESGHTKVILVEEPFNCLATQLIYSDEVYGTIRADYEIRVNEFAQEYGLEYWQLDEEAKLVERDFADEFHLGQVEARERFTRVLARRLASIPPRNQMSMP